MIGSTNPQAFSTAERSNLALLDCGCAWRRSRARGRVWIENSIVCRWWWS